SRVEGRRSPWANRAKWLASRSHSLLEMNRRIGPSIARVVTTMRFQAALFFGITVLCQAAESPAARWEGTVQLPGRVLIWVIDLAQDSRGQWSGSAIVPGSGVKGARLTDIAVQESNVSFTVK